MKNKLYLSLLVCAALFYACSPESGNDVPEDGTLIEVCLNAGIDGSKVALDETLLHPSWQEGDRLAVYDGSAIREFTLFSGAGSSQATFSGQISASASNLKAVYPYSAAKLEGSKLTYSVPAEQSVSAAGADPQALVMYSEGQLGSALHFSQCTSMLRFSAPEGIRNLVFRLDEGSVTMNLPGTAGNYAVAINPGSYSGLTLYIVADGGSYIMESSTPFDITTGLSVSLGELALDESCVIIKTPAELAAFLKSTSAGDKSRVLILNDIDMRGTSFEPASGFGGFLDGNLRQIDITGGESPLFGTNNGIITDLVLTGTPAPSSGLGASLSLTNNGRLINVTNKAKISGSASAPLSGPIVMGGITAYNYGPVVNCTNEGEVSFTSTSSITGAALGGVAGYSEGTFDNCSNSAPVRLVAKYGSGMCAIGKIASSASNLGGIAGAAFEGFAARSCVNSGEIVFINNEVDKCTSIYQRSQIGGIAGSPYGDISKCSNTGNISVTATTTTRAAYTANYYIFDVGGISGGSFHETGDYQAVNDHTNISQCTNGGNIDLVLDCSKSNSPVGGIVGWGNGEHKTIACKTSGCTNTGNITMSGAGKVRIGGIMGGTGAIENCTNKGTIHVISANSSSAVGGINGFHSQDHILDACINEGDVKSDVALQGGIGGLIGCHGGVNLATSESCKVLCDVVSGDSGRGYVGMVIGAYNNNTSSVTLGSAQNPIEVKGSVSAGGVTTELTEKNFRDFLMGTNFVATVHVIYAYCNTPGPATYAEGTVAFDDNTPAAGISVSDGFSVAVTDSQGKYRLATRPDSWYIFVSLPSNAVIEKRSDGCPAFYQTYTGPGTDYNFTLKKGAVENSFMLFALADPQSHYQNRGTGKADTDRFNQEAVPAINAQIATQSLPCYGVTLGDIVYSEGNRNSNPGMVTMRSHFAKLNMPVFQTMGNHDYTYFYSTKPLATDTRTSTLYLRAQRNFEEVFGPVNFSFNRGDVHVVCMRNIIYDSNTDASSYHCGYTDDQWAWLQADLANVPKTKMVILCGHIPLVSNTSREHVSQVLSLLKQYKSAKIFSGHTHYKRYAPSVGGIAEHIHAAVCGQWWWSNVEGDGAPNGYTVYKIEGTSFKDEYSIGMNTSMNTRDYQIRVYQGNITNGGNYAKFKWPHEASRLLINVFNGDSRWKVQVYENDVLSGTATLMSYKRQTFDSVTSGTTYTVDASASNDWWAIGYHIGVLGRGRSNSTSYYTSMFHMYTYTLKDPSASVKVVATDPYGNTYSCTSIVSTDCWYPAYMKYGNVN